ncbi:DNA repair protein XRCC4 isoform X2 [Amia ocellicauda]|uniref:DNA repair protein XRCC4 isoform X2 n=1 Tax=Amia ocellicauda TaxID=2972642 RepID=UPI0034645033
MGTSVRQINISSQPSQSFFLRVNWAEDVGSGFTVVLSDGLSAWSGEVSEEDISREAEEMEMRREKYLEDLRQALTDGGKEPSRYSFDLSEDGVDGSALHLSYEKVQKDISFKLGSVELHTISKPVEVVKELICHGLDNSAELQACNAHLQGENERLRGEWDYVNGELEKYVQAKEALEKDLYNRFVLVLNEKKAKIRSLQEKIKEFQEEMEAEKEKRDTTTVESNDAKEPAYEASTDEENAENKECSETSASARVKKPGCSSPDSSLTDIPDIAPSRKRRQRGIKGQGSGAKKVSQEPRDKTRNRDSSDQATFFQSSTVQFW